MTLSNREKVLLNILIFVILIGAFLYFLMLPLADKIKENSQILDQDRMILNHLEQANETGTLTNQQKDIQNEIIRIEKILPTQVRIPEVLLKILYIADGIGLQEESITMQNTIIESDINTTKQENSEENSKEEYNNTKELNEKLLILPINHSFRGTYDEIKNYIDRIQNCERRIDIIEYQISNSDKEGNQLSASFLLHSYALVKDTQNYSEFVDYDFIKENYGRNNPFMQGAFTVIEDDHD